MFTDHKGREVQAGDYIQAGRSYGTCRILKITEDELTIRNICTGEVTTFDSQDHPGVLKDWDVLQDYTPPTPSLSVERKEGRIILSIPKEAAQTTTGWDVARAIYGSGGVPTRKYQTITLNGREVQTWFTSGVGRNQGLYFHVSWKAKTRLVDPEGNFLRYTSPTTVHLRAKATEPVAMMQEV